MKANKVLGTANGRVILNLSRKGIKKNWKAIDRMLAAGVQVVNTRKN